VEVEDRGTRTQYTGKSDQVCGHPLDMQSGLFVAGDWQLCKLLECLGERAVDLVTGDVNEPRNWQLS
jgi:hypothetical protein